VAGAFGGVFALSQAAEASERCTSKPAVCALQKAKQAKAPQQATTPRETKQVTRIQRCTSKPAVCALQRAAEPKKVVVTEVVREKPAVERCTSKPAVCALQRAKAANEQK